MISLEVFILFQREVRQEKRKMAKKERYSRERRKIERMSERGKGKIFGEAFSRQKERTQHTHTNTNLPISTHKVNEGVSNLLCSHRCPVFHPKYSFTRE